jgi:hypothetical protein
VKLARASLSIFLLFLLSLLGCGSGSSGQQPLITRYAGVWSGIWTDTQVPPHHGTMLITIAPNQAATGTVTDQTDGTNGELVQSAVQVDGKFQLQIRMVDPATPLGYYVLQVNGPTQSLTDTKMFSNYAVQRGVAQWTETITLNKQ